MNKKKLIFCTDVTIPTIFVPLITLYFKGVTSRENKPLVSKIVYLYCFKVDIYRT